MPLEMVRGGRVRDGSRLRAGARGASARGGDVKECEEGVWCAGC